MVWMHHTEKEVQKFKNGNNQHVDREKKTRFLIVLLAKSSSSSSSSISPLILVVEYI